MYIYFLKIGTNGAYLVILKIRKNIRNQVKKIELIKKCKIQTCTGANAHHKIEVGGVHSDVHPTK